MITEYKKIYDKIIAHDDKKGIIKFEYQDNINEILNQKNVVEELENMICGLKNKKDFIEKYKDNFNMMIFDENYGIKGIALIFLAFIIVLFAYMLGVGVWGNFFRIVSIPVLLSAFPTIIFQYKKYKNDMELNLINVDEQIKEFEETLEKEKELLVTLKNNNSKNNKDISNTKHIIDNTKNNKLINIQKQKHLYETYRKWCSKIQEKKDLNFLIDSYINSEDLEIIKEMSDRTIDIISKKKTKSRGKFC